MTTATQIAMDHLGPLTTSLSGIHITNRATADTDHSLPNISAAPEDRSPHSRNSSHASTVSSSTNRISPATNDRSPSRNDTTSSQASTRGKLPEEADPEYAYVYVPTLSSLQTTTGNSTNLLT